MNPTRDDFDRPITRRERLALAAFLTVCSLVVLACDGGCARPPGMPGFHNVSAQVNGVAQVKLLCPGPVEMPLRVYVGTASIIGKRHLLTAKHMTLCHVPGSDTETMEPLGIAIDDGRHGDEVIIAHVARREAEQDVAQLTVDEDLKDAAPVAVGPRPTVGQTACEVSMFPRFGYRCGLVQPNVDGDNQIYLDMKVEHGNSGSPLYVQGSLVGVVVATITCQDKSYCVGIAEPIQGIPLLRD